MANINGGTVGCVCTVNDAEPIGLFGANVEMLIEFVGSMGFIEINAHTIEGTVFEFGWICVL
jgi:hypothetical protein